MHVKAWDFLPNIATVIGGICGKQFSRAIVTDVRLMDQTH
jgi:hypothetical protein